MKKLIVALGFILSCPSLWAQEFPAAWKSKFSFEPSRWYYTEDGKYVLGRNPSQAEMLDGLTGKSIWVINFKNDLKVKELARATYKPEEGVVMFYNPDEKKKNGEKIIVDFTTGKELWRTDGYAGTDADDNYHFANSIGYLSVKGTTIAFDNASKKFVGVEVRTGNKKWESKAYPQLELSKNIGITEIEGSEFCQVFIYDEDPLKIQVLYMNVLTGAETDGSQFTESSGNYSRISTNKVRIKQTAGNTVVKLTGTMKAIAPTKIKFELRASGGNSWTKEWEGSAVRQIWNDGPYVRMDVQGDKIFVMSKQITVFDLKTGNQLWQQPFDNVDASAGLKAKQEFGIAGWPLVDGDYVYYVDLQIDNAIKKVEAQTGKVIWKSEKINSDDRVPNLALVDGMLIAQFGGMINTQTYIPNSNGGGTYKNENRFDGKYGVRALDPATGATIWNTAKMADKLGDKFADRITPIYSVGSKLYVCSDQNLFALDAKTGNVTFKTPIAASKIGDVFDLTPSEDGKALYVFCDNGIASADAASGKLNYATKTGEIFWKMPGTNSYFFRYGKNFFVWVGAKDFVGFDLANGTVKGKMEDNTDPQMAENGNYIFVRDGAKVTKYQVNK